MLIASLLLTATQAAESAAPAETVTRRECDAVLVASPGKKARGPGQVYSATRILDLEFRTLLRRRPQGPRTLQLKLYTPRGHLYQVLTVPFGVGTAAGGPQKRWVEGHPQPLDEQTAVPVSADGGRRYSVRAVLPVAGTTIMVNSLYGEWKAEPHLDGQSSPCGPAAQFVIDQ